MEIPLKKVENKAKCVLASKKERKEISGWICNDFGLSPFQSVGASKIGREFRYRTRRFIIENVRIYTKLYGFISGSYNRKEQMFNCHTRCIFMEMVINAQRFWLKRWPATTNETNGKTKKYFSMVSFASDHEHSKQMKMKRKKSRTNKSRVMANIAQAHIYISCSLEWYTHSNADCDSPSIVTQLAAGHWKKRLITYSSSNFM